MKKLITLLSVLGLAFAPQVQASLADKIAEAEAEWIVGSWEADLDGNKVSLSFNWAINSRECDPSLARRKTPRSCIRRSFDRKIISCLGCQTHNTCVCVSIHICGETNTI